MRPYGGKASLESRKRRTDTQHNIQGILKPEGQRTRPWRPDDPVRMVDDTVGQFDDAYYTGMYGGHRWKSKLHAMIQDQEVYARGPTINSNEPEEVESAGTKVR